MKIEDFHSCKYRYEVIISSTLNQKQISSGSLPNTPFEYVDNVIFTVYLSSDWLNSFNMSSFLNLFPNILTTKFEFNLVMTFTPLSLAPLIFFLDFKPPSLENMSQPPFLSLFLSALRSLQASFCVFYCG